MTTGQEENKSESSEKRNKEKSADANKENPVEKLEEDFSKDVLIF
ncbi:hypothetical protein [Paenibacillus thermotolerans]|nr:MULTISPECIES: hypothetical protein [unclassified Paenibacillus]